MGNEKGRNDMSAELDEQNQAGTKPEAEDRSRIHCPMCGRSKKPTRWYRAGDDRLIDLTKVRSVRVLYAPEGASRIGYQLVVVGPLVVVSQWARNDTDRCIVVQGTREECFDALEDIEDKLNALG